MIFEPALVRALPDGAHHRTSVCLAFVGNPIVDARWATLSAMEIQFPTNATQSVLCQPHPNLATARRLALDAWRASPPSLRSEWVALVAADSPIRPDAVVRAVLSGERVTCIGDTYVLHESVIGEPPWFDDAGVWLGPYANRPELGPEAGPEFDNYTGERAVLSDTDAAKMIMVCVPSLGKTSLMWVAHAVALAAPVASTRACLVAFGYEVAAARQAIVESVLAMRPVPAYLLFFGDDMIAPPAGLRMLFETMRARDTGAVAGLYFVKSSPPDTPLMWLNSAPGTLVVGRDYALGDAVECHGTGLDFVLLRTRDLEKLPALKFKTVCEWVDGRGMMMETEDSFFWKRWIAATGMNPVVDTRCRVAHYDSRTGRMF